MNELVPLDIDRQLNVGNAIADALAADRPTPLLPGTRARGEALLSVTLDLGAFAGPAPGQVDRATDAVITAFDRVLEEQERVLLDSVVPLGEAQRQSLARARFLRTRIFPQGTGFLRRRVDLEWRDLRDLRAALQDPEVTAALDAQGLRPAAEHVFRHVTLYGRVIGSDAGPAGSAEARASEAWHEAFQLYATQVTADYHEDPEMQRALLGAYEDQLEQQRAAARIAARARKGHGDGIDAGPGSSRGAPAPAGG